MQRIWFREKLCSGSGSLLFGLSVHAPIAPRREGVVQLHIDWGRTGDTDIKKSAGRAFNRAETPTRQNNSNRLRATPSVVASSFVRVNVYCDRQTAAARGGGGAAKGQRRIRDLNLTNSTFKVLSINIFESIEHGLHPSLLEMEAKFKYYCFGPPGGVCANGRGGGGGDSDDGVGSGAADCSHANSS
ncbi:hypothetical protein KY290_000251 [Solanum tuberosum]|uniref:Uncharacterized protein n=1 Tax=Solanum tuberosum TaxID=4113 RepID=A0ABQ7WIS7_SOLTU|nr:hypothetical protein KY290_000251 [Solanum tuberosum]